MLYVSNIFLQISYSIFRGDDKRRGQLRFEGNLLFTHFSEIDAPDPFAAPPNQTIHTNADEVKQTEM